MSALPAWLQAESSRFDLPAWLRRQLVREAEARSGFYSIPAGMMLGIVAVYGWDLRPSAVACGALAIVLGVAAVLANARTAIPVATLAAALAGMTLSLVELDRADTVIFSGETTARIEGRVLWRDYDERGRHRYLVAVAKTERPVLSRPPKQVQILVSSKHAPLDIGATYRGLVRLRPPSGPALPGSYDFAFGAFFDGLGAYGFALGPPDAVAQGGVPTLSTSERLTDLRLWISDRIRAVVGGGEGAVAAAIITGERSGIPDDVEKWLRVTGLSHVLSISGVHMALAAGFAMVLVRAFCALFPPAALMLPAKKIAATAALVVSGAYLALSGGDVAATRSFIMIAIMLTAVVFDRSALTLRNVAIAAVIVLAITPHALFTASFQMSFAATAAIIAIYGTIAKRLHPVSNNVKRGFATRFALELLGIAISSTVAGAATAPYAAFHFQRMAPFGLVANMLALPLFSFWIMPIALLAMLAMPFGLDAILLRLLGDGLTLVFTIARTLAVYIPDGPTGRVAPIGVAILTVSLLIGCFLSSRLRLVAIPIAAVGLFLCVDRSDPPEVLVFEDGREVALIDAAGRMSTLKKRPNRFVLGQWQRAFPSSAGATPTASAFACETVEDASSTQLAATGGRPNASTETRRKAKPRRYQFCRASTRSGLRLVWTDDYRLLGRACDEADIAIVARAVRTNECRSSATLLTLRGLRASGSVAVARSGTDRPVLHTAIDRPWEEWNRHRRAPWPERWRRDEDADVAATSQSRSANEGSDLDSTVSKDQ